MKKRKRGYILLLTLMVIVFVAIILTNITLLSIDTSTAVKRKSSSLQSRWGDVSLQVAFRFNAQKVLSDVSTENELIAVSKEIPSRSTLLQLGDERYEVVFSNEQAKVNLNMYFVNQGEFKTKSLIKSQSSNSPPVVFQPSVGLSFANNQNLFHSWGQVFEGHSNLYGIKYSSQIKNATNELTLWGRGGKLNIHAATDRSLNEVAKIAVNGSQAADLVKQRRKFPNSSVSELVNSIDVADSDRDNLESLLTETDCYSIWISKYNKDHTLVGRSFLVFDRMGAQTERIYYWTW